MLSEASAAAMADKHAELPDKYSLGDSWGLGWIRFGWDGHRLIGHDGNTIGQAAFLRVLPEEGLAVTLLTNGGNARDLYEELYREIFAELGRRRDAAPARPAGRAGLGRSRRSTWAGTSAPASASRCSSATAARCMRTTITGPLAELMPEPTQEYPMTPVDRRPVRGQGAESAQTWTPVTFYSLPTGEQYLHFGVRATPKVG